MKTHNRDEVQIKRAGMLRDLSYIQYVYICIYLHKDLDMDIDIDIGIGINRDADTTIEALDSSLFLNLPFKQPKCRSISTSTSTFISPLKDHYVYLLFARQKDF